MAFPSVKPSSRRFSPGDWPIKTVKSQSGVEDRLLYGSKRTGMTLELQYKNITDANAELFLDDFVARKGTYNTFNLDQAEDETKAGWDGNDDAIGTATGNKWRYAGPPQVTQVAKGRSSVSVKLVGVI